MLEDVVHGRLLQAFDLVVAVGDREDHAGASSAGVHEAVADLLVYHHEPLGDHVQVGHVGVHAHEGADVCCSHRVDVDILDLYVRLVLLVDVFVVDELVAVVSRVYPADDRRYPVRYAAHVLERLIELLHTSEQLYEVEDAAHAERPDLVGAHLAVVDREDARDVCLHCRDELRVEAIVDAHVVDGQREEMVEVVVVVLFARYLPADGCLEPIEYSCDLRLHRERIERGDQREDRDDVHPGDSLHHRQQPVASRCVCTLLAYLFERHIQLVRALAHLVLDRVGRHHCRD